MPIDYDAFEAAGHDLTMLAGMHAGSTTYYCEGCGALVQVKGSLEIVLFHVHKGSWSTQEKCALVGFTASSKRETLKEKLDALNEKSMERLREV